MQNVYIIGSRGLPAKYGGFETFVQELVTRKQDSRIVYHVACLSDEGSYQHFDFQGTDCFTICPPQLGPARVIAYDTMALNYALKLAEKSGSERPVFYILGNTMGPLVQLFTKRVHRLGGRLLVNPDGLEWRRTKWPKPVRTYLKLAERAMTKYADLVVADNPGIASYLEDTYGQLPVTTIAYGTDLEPSKLATDSSDFQSFLQEWNLRAGEYYLIVGRFVAENNYETMIREFMQSQTQRPLVLVCNYQGSSYFESLRQKTGFDQDSRIRFVGTVYDSDLLKKIRQEAYAYIHGHEVGGTNPGLLEALAHSDVNLVLGVDFNRVVAEETALYWSKESDDLTSLLEKIETNRPSHLGEGAKKRMQQFYSWEKIVDDYEEVFRS
ncbi:beta 1-4 rhamnosyltransferase Cps2T [Streptococcus sp. 10F2]